MVRASPRATPVFALSLSLLGSCQASNRIEPASESDAALQIPDARGDSFIDDATTVGVSDGDRPVDGNEPVDAGVDTSVPPSADAALDVNFPPMNDGSAMRFPGPGVVCADAPLRLTFASPVTLGKSGTVKLFRASQPSTPIDTIDVAATTFTDVHEGRTFHEVLPIFLDGNDAVIYMHTGAMSTPDEYLVTTDDGLFIDSMKNPVAGISAADGWTFRTVSPSPMSPTALNVALDGGGEFCTIQGAVDYVPSSNTTPTTIHVQAGTYHEIVYIPGKSALSFVGDGPAETLLEYPNNDKLQQGLGTGYRAMVEAENSDGLVFDSLTLHNTTPEGGSQAEALRIDPGDKAILRNSHFLSFQDTLLLTGRVYVDRSYVEGNVDFIWGGGTAYFDSSQINVVGEPGFVVQSRNGANYGYIFVDSTISTSAGTNGTTLARIAVDEYPKSNVAYINCTLGSGISPEGWLITSSTGEPDVSQLRFWEYESTDVNGATVDVSKRASGSKQLSSTEAMMLRDASVVFDGWVPSP